MLGGDLPTGTVSSSANHPPRPREPSSPVRITHSTAGDGQPDSTRHSSRKVEQPAEKTHQPESDETSKWGVGPDDVPLTEATRDELEAEIAELNRELDAYEAREQRIIDRYERLLDEQRRQQNDESAERRYTTKLMDRLRRTKSRMLRTIGLR